MQSMGLGRGAVRVGVALLTPTSLILGNFVLDGNLGEMQWCWHVSHFKDAAQCSRFC